MTLCLVVEPELETPPALSATGTPAGRTIRASLDPPSNAMRTVPLGWGSRSARWREEPTKAVGIRGHRALDRVERGALAQVVAAHPEREAALAAGDGT